MVEYWHGRNWVNFFSLSTRIRTVHRKRCNSQFSTSWPPVVLHHGFCSQVVSAERGVLRRFSGLGSSQARVVGKKKGFQRVVRVEGSQKKGCFPTWWEGDRCNFKFVNFAWCKSCNLNPTKKIKIVNFDNTFWPTLDLPYHFFVVGNRSYGSEYAPACNQDDQLEINFGVGNWVDPC